MSGMSRTGGNVPRKSGKPRPKQKFKFYWGFAALVCCTLALATCLTAIAWARASGIVWEPPVETFDMSKIEVEGFVLRDLSDTLTTASGRGSSSTSKSNVSNVLGGISLDSGTLVRTLISPLLTPSESKDSEKRSEQETSGDDSANPVPTAPTTPATLTALTTPATTGEASGADIIKVTVTDATNEISSDFEAQSAEQDNQANFDGVISGDDDILLTLQTMGEVSDNMDPATALEIIGLTVSDDGNSNPTVNVSDIGNTETASADNSGLAGPEGVQGSANRLTLAQTEAQEPIEDFGPLPKYLSGYEDIILTVMDAPTLTEPVFTEEPDSDPLLGTETDPGIDFVLTEVGPAWKEHVVKAGETLAGIASSYGGLTAHDLLKANGLRDANRLTENQLLLIPNSPSLVDETLAEVRVRQARIAAAREKIEPLKVTAYVVVQGDSLWSISNSQNIELDTLVGSNTLKGATLRPGTVLRIPNQEGIFYRLKKGEKLADVCKRYEVDLERLKKVNVTLDVAKLREGDEVFLPEARPEAVTETKKAETPKSTTSPSPSKTASRSSASAKTSTTAKNTGKTISKGFRWPIMGRINSPFGWRRHPITRRSNFHTGIDIQASMGTTIRAAREGTVAYSGWMGGYGRVIVIEHTNGLSSLYAHCSALLVGKGTKVSQGQSVARVGMSGTATGPHLHFEVRNGHSPVNPLQYLK